MVFEFKVQILGILDSSTQDIMKLNFLRKGMVFQFSNEIDVYLPNFSIVGWELW